MKEPRRLRYISYAICLILVSLFICLVDWTKAVAIIRTMPFIGFALYCSLILSTFIIGFLRFKIILGRSLGWKATGYAYFLSKTGGSLTPARIGDFAPFLEKEFRKKEIAFAIILDKIIEFYISILAGFIGLLIMHNLPLPLILLTAGLLFLATFAILLLRRQGFWAKGILFFNHWLAESGNGALRIIPKLLRWFVSTLEKASFETTRIGPRYPAAFALSGVAYVLTVIAAQSLFHACGIQISAFLVLELITLSGLLMIFSFIPGGFGIVEISLLAVMLQYGVKKEAYAAYAVISRTISLAAMFLFYFISLTLTRSNKNEHPSD